MKILNWFNRLYILKLNCFDKKVNYLEAKEIAWMVKKLRSDN